jgi:hypothetical protein
MDEFDVIRNMMLLIWTSYDSGFYPYIEVLWTILAAFVTVKYNGLELSITMNSWTGVTSPRMPARTAKLGHLRRIAHTRRLVDQATDRYDTPSREQLVSAPHGIEAGHRSKRNHQGIIGGDLMS